MVELEGKSYKLCPNQFIFLPANAFHKFYANTENPWSIYWLHFNGTDRDLILQLFNMENPVHALTAQMLPNIIRAFYNLFDILSRGYSNRLMIHLSSTLRLLLTSLSLDEVHTHGQKFMKYNYVDICINEMKKTLINNFH
ncbi:MAG: hypothetical protein GX963_09725 [Bacteroidales bacterium]|nr:hypothetical protein [Bacteroidales bacterium]